MANVTNGFDERCYLFLLYTCSLYTKYEINTDQLCKVYIFRIAAVSLHRLYSVSISSSQANCAYNMAFSGYTEPFPTNNPPSNVDVFTSLL